MTNETIYLLYNTKASDIKLHAGPALDRGMKSSEYEDKDEFVILYGPGDERKYTDIKVLSKTKLKQRPKSTSSLSHIPRGQVEGVLLRRTNSLLEFEDFLLRRIPSIRPLLSEAEIARLQRAQEECKVQRYRGFGGVPAGIDSPWSAQRERGSTGLKGDPKMKPAEFMEEGIETRKQLDEKIVGKSSLDLDQINKEKKIAQTRQGQPQDEEKKEISDGGKRSRDKSVLDGKSQRETRSKLKTVDTKLKEPYNTRKTTSKNKTETMKPPINKKKENEDKSELGKSRNNKKSVMDKDDANVGRTSKSGRKQKPQIKNENNLGETKKKKKSRYEEGNVGNKSKSPGNPQPQVGVKSDQKSSGVKSEAKNKNPKLLEKGDVDVGNKSKKGGRRQSQSSHKNDSTGKYKKIEEHISIENIIELAKSDKKGSRSSKSELSTKSNKSGKGGKSLKNNIDHKSKTDIKLLKSDRAMEEEQVGKYGIDVDHKPKTDTKSLKSGRAMEEEQVGKDGIDLESTKKSKISNRASSTTKDSAKQKESTSKGGHPIRPRKQNDKKEHRGGGTSDEIGSTNSPRSKKNAGQEHENMPKDGSKGTESNTTKDKRGRSKSTLSAKERSAGKKSDQSVSFAFSSKKKDSLYQTRKRSRNRSTTLEYMIKYVLSNPIFIKLGWTLHAANKTFNRVVTFKANPANPELYCFREREEAVLKRYSSGNVAVNLQTDGRGEILYPSGHPAMVIKKTSSGLLLIIYSDKKKEPSVDYSNNAKLLGLFDSFGNGVVYDKLGKKILNFNQLEGIYTNPLSKAPYKWHWRNYKELAQHRIKEIMNYIAKENKIPHNKGKKQSSSISVQPTANRRSTEEKEYEKLLAELPYPVPPKSKTKKKSCSSGFKSVILKINDEMILRINGQDSVMIIFSADKILQRIDLGVKIDPESVERVEELSLEKIEEIPCVFESLAKLSPSLERLRQELNPERKTKLKKPHTSNTS